MSTVANVLTFARTQCQTDSNGLTDTNGIVWANESLFDFRRRLVDESIDALGIQEAYRDASVPTTDGNGSTFLYPADAMFLKTIEVNYTDTTASNYIRAEQVDQANLPAQTSMSWLRKNASRQTPKFADNGDWYEVFPAFTGTDNLSQAIRIIYFQKPTEYAATTDTISYPESLDYRILGWRTSSLYLKSLRNAEALTAAKVFDVEYENRVKQFVDTLGRGSQQPLQATPLQITGWNF